MIYIKVKGNKKIKYSLKDVEDLMMKYQLKNQYTLVGITTSIIRKVIKFYLKINFTTDPEVSNYAFNITQGEDKQGLYFIKSS